MTSQRQRRLSVREDVAVASVRGPPACDCRDTVYPSRSREASAGDDSEATAKERPSGAAAQDHAGELLFSQTLAAAWISALDRYPVGW